MQWRLEHRPPNLAQAHWRQPRRGCWGHIPTNILVGGRQWEYSPNIITYFRIEQTNIRRPRPTSPRELTIKKNFTKICHFEITKQKICPSQNLSPGGEGNTPSHTPPSLALRPPTVNSRWRHCVCACVCLKPGRFVGNWLRRGWNGHQQDAVWRTVWNRSALPHCQVLRYRKSVNGCSFYTVYWISDNICSYIDLSPFYLYNVTVIFWIESCNEFTF